MVPEKLKLSICRLLYKNNTQYQMKLADRLGTTQVAVYMRQYATGKSQKNGKRVHHELIDRQTEQSQNI